MNEEYDHNPDFKPWGPFIPSSFESEPITRADIAVASIVWGLTLCCIFLAVYLGYGQSKQSRSPLRSVYVWLIWLELLVSFLMGLECYLHLHKLIKPSFAFYFTILFWWCIQVQLLLQIIINRIRVIVPDRKRSRHIMIGTATIVTLINISVFNIWIPARLQTSERFIFINEVWDRIEKVLYLIIDGLLNWYFLKVVKANLVNNGLQKYNKLLRFNQRIIVLSLLMDVMIIGAMSIPNSFVYIQFHPLAYIVKLNIEMVMANLIKRIAVSTSKRTGNSSLAQEFASSGANKSSTANHTSNISAHARRTSFIELSANVFRKSGGRNDGRAESFKPTGNQIKKTEEIFVKSEPAGGYESDTDRDRWEAIKAGKSGLEDEEWIVGTGGRLVVSQNEIRAAKSMDDVTEGDESVRSEDVQRREESDDEVVLVRPDQTHGQANGGWRRLDG